MANETTPKKRNPTDSTLRNIQAASKRIAALQYELRAVKKQLDVQKILLKRAKWVMPVKKK